jgi:hypothetical protein
LLWALVVGALGLLLATPYLITPWPTQAPWYESAAFFPRLGLALTVLGALGELHARRTRSGQVGNEELDSSTAELPRALMALACFALYALVVPVLGFGVSTALFLLACGRASGLGWRVALALAAPLALALWAVFVVGLKVAFGHGLLF